jgi:RNA polymerase sigma-70 factor (ECF subfamily)
MSNPSMLRMSRTEESLQQGTNDQRVSIERLLREHYSYIQRLALSILGDPHEAEDAAQETFIAANRSLDRFRGDSSPRTWLTAIAVNTCRGRLRKRRTRQGLQHALQALHLAQPVPVSMEDAAIQQDTLRALRQAVAGLDDRHRLPVLLRYVHALSVPEIAAALKTNPGTIYSRLHYARHMLIARLDAQNPHVEACDEKQSHPDA